MLEAIFAVTPSETIKYSSPSSSSPLRLKLIPVSQNRTKLIDDAKRPVRQYPSGLLRGSAAIIRAEGIRGIYRGLFPVMMRQGANSAVRFTTYTTLKQYVQSTSTRPGQNLPSTITFGIGAVAGLVTVYTTMPLECVFKIG